MTARRRMTLLGVALLCVVVAACAVVAVLVSRSHSMSHRADAALDGIRSLPGVRSATVGNYPESGDRQRRAVVTVSTSATSTQVASILAGAEKVARGSLIGDVSVRDGSAYTVVEPKTPHAGHLAAPLAALAQQPHGARVTVGTTAYKGPYVVWVAPDGRQSVEAVIGLVEQLRKHHAPVGAVVVGRRWHADLTVSGSWKPVERVLRAVQPISRHMESISVSKSGVHLTVLPGFPTVRAHRALAATVRDAFPGKKLSVSRLGQTTIATSGTGARS